MTEMHVEIRQFIVDTFLALQSDKQVADSASFLETGVVDSAGILELVAFLEEHYRIAVDDQDMVPENLDSVDRLVTFVRRKRELSRATV